MVECAALGLGCGVCGGGRPVGSFDDQLDGAVDVWRMGKGGRDWWCVGGGGYLRIFCLTSRSVKAGSGLCLWPLLAIERTGAVAWKRRRRLEEER